MSDESFQGVPDGTADAAASAPELEAPAGNESAEPNTPAGDEPREPKTFTEEEVARKLQKEREVAYRKAKRDIVAQAQEAQRPANYPAPTFDQFNGDLDRFTDALADWKADQRVMQRERQSQQETVVSSYEQRVEQARDTRYPDYDDVVGKPYEDGGPAISDLMADAIMMEANGTDIAYHLGRNVQESIRIAKLPPVQQALEIGKLAVKLAGQAPPAKKVSSAPNPIKPVGSRTVSGASDPSDPRSVKTMSTAAWIAARNRQVEQG